MFVKDSKGRWYEVPEEALESKEIAPEKIAELQAVELAEARKKAAEILAAQDEGTIAAIRECLMAFEARHPVIATRVGLVKGSNDCHTNDCHTNDCHTNDCHINDCHTNDCHTNDCVGMDMTRVVNPLWDPREWYNKPRYFRSDVRRRLR